MRAERAERAEHLPPRGWATVVKAAPVRVKQRVEPKRVRVGVDTLGILATI